MANDPRDLVRKVTQRGTYELRRAKVQIYEAIRSRQANWLGLGPAAFDRWLLRFGGRPRAWVPPNWREAPAAQRQATSRIAVVLHAYYPDLLDPLIEDLEKLPVPFDVLVTNATGEELDAKRFSVGQADRVVVLPVENHGRDIAPLVWLVNAGYLDPYDLVLKIHTKRSDWRASHGELAGTGSQWSEALRKALVGTPKNVERILQEFSRDPGLGCLTAPGNVVGPEHWGANEHGVEELLKRLGLKIGYGDLHFAAGSMYWIRGFVLQGLRALALGPEDFEDEAGQIDGTTAHALERIIGFVTEEAGYRISDTGALPAALSAKSVEGSVAENRFMPGTTVGPAARVVPFYLPQFHPAEVNDRAWGHGFTEWANVAQGRRAFAGHNQPLVPSELGFYDLRLDQVRHQQLELEEYAGVAGLMYYYYWFSGERVLDLPVQRLLSDSTLEQPFCLMWANENWTKTWDGRAEDVLLAQRYDEVGAEAFIDDVMPALLDHRYLRVDGKAVLAVYRPAQIPRVAEVVETWRSRAREAGAGELLLLSVNTGKSFDGLGEDYESFGFDGTMGFPPHGIPWTAQPTRDLKVDSTFLGRILSYRALARDALVQARTGDSSAFPAVMVNFDNSARKTNQADVWYGSNPYTFRKWLAETVATVATRPASRRVVFVNAWNEWAESAVLEPTLRWGPTYLQAVRSVVYQ